MSITIFTDGSSRGNPGPGGWGAIIRTDSDRTGDVIELGGGEDQTTNNRMELCAAINALAHVGANHIAGNIVVQSDSKYVIQGITSWVAGWKRNGWKTAAKKDVGNRDLWEALASATIGRAIEWRYVKGHAGHPGNERCDEIATAFADKRDPHLYAGPRKLYTIDLDAEPSASATLAARIASASKGRSSAKAFSYLSLVDGIFETHKTWAECEARVKGVKGARFKKALSADEEKSIAREWGF